MCEPNIISLYEGKPGERIRLISLDIEGVMRRRLLDLGFMPGAVIEVVRKSPLGDPIAYRVSQTVIALRKEESIHIKGELISDEN